MYRTVLGNAFSLTLSPVMVRRRRLHSRTWLLTGWIISLWRLGATPLPHLPPEVQVSLAEASSIVQAAAGDDLAAFEGFSRGARLEYAQLVVKQLRCGKLGLSTTCKGGGTTFAVSKPGGERLREVWHGKRVSEAAQSPPKPRHLASPTALSFLECTHEQPLRLSKRDASCWFDQLKLPVGLRQYMAKPPLSSDELACAGMPVEEQKQHIEPGQTWERGQLFPLHHVWPMGFSWSSFIAQEEMLNICQEAGLPEDVLMACDSTTPQSFKLVGQSRLTTSCSSAMPALA